MIARDGPPVASVRLTEPLLPKVMQPRGLDQLRRIPIAAFLTVLADVTATSFGALLLPAATGLPASAGVHLYLMSTTMGQLAASLFSGFPYATAGATIELVPLLIPITALLDPQWPACHRASTLLAAYTMTSALVGFLLLCVSRFRLGILFRCIPFIVLKAALTGVGLFMMVEGIKTGGTLADLGLSSLLEAGAMTRVLCTIVLCSCLALVQHTCRSPVAIVAFLAAATVSFHALPLTGKPKLLAPWWFTESEDGAGDPGTLSVSSSPLGLLPLFSLANVHWDVLPRALPYSLSCCLVHALCTITDLISIEAVATARPAASAEDATRPPAAAAPMDLDLELGSIGMANLFAALVGTMPNYVQLSPSIANTNFSRGTRASGGARAGPWCAALEALSLLAVSQVAAAVPRAVVGAFMIHMGLGFMGEGAETMRHTASTFDKVLLSILVLPHHPPPGPWTRPQPLLTIRPFAYAALRSSWCSCHRS